MSDHWDLIEQSVIPVALAIVTTFIVIRTLIGVVLNVAYLSRRHR
jgi:hypothetical protein